MKILGEKSLSSKVIIGLILLFIIISIAEIIVLQANIKAGVQFENIFDITILSVLDITGITALIIVLQFIKIFNKLKNSKLFDTENAKRLNIISISCFIMCFLYIILSIITFFNINNFIDTIISYIFVFSIVFSIIFFVAGIGIKILNEIYKKAINYKEENDLVI